MSVMAKWWQIVKQFTAHRLIVNRNCALPGFGTVRDGENHFAVGFSWITGQHFSVDQSDHDVLHEHFALR